MTLDWNAQELSIHLEEAIDKWGLAATLGIMVDIAEGKARHVEENWQDKGLARLWRRVAQRLDKLDTGGL